MTPRLKVAVLDDYQRVAFQFADWSGVQNLAQITVFDRNLADVNAAAASLADYDIICLMRERMPVSAELLARLPKLKLIVATGLRNRTIDLPAAQARGVTVATVAKGGGGSTSEMTWALILAAARHLPREVQSVRDGGWQQTVGTMLMGETLGVIGLGRQGAMVAKVGAAFGMDVVAWSPNLTPERAQAAGARLVSKTELLSRSRVVTLHMVLSERTRGLLGAQDLALLRPDAILVNTSRGPLIDETALLDVLRRGAIAAAGLDVFDQEPLPTDHPLRSLNNVIASPHLGYVTRDAYEAFYSGMVTIIEDFAAGRPVPLLQPA